MFRNCIDGIPLQGRKSVGAHGDFLQLFRVSVYGVSLKRFIRVRVFIGLEQRRVSITCNVNASLMSSESTRRGILYSVGKDFAPSTRWPNQGIHFGRDMALISEDMNFLKCLNDSM